MKNPRFAHTDAWPMLEGDVPKDHLVYRQMSSALREALVRSPRLDAPQEVLHRIASDLESVAALMREYPQRTMEDAFARLSSDAGSVADVFDAFDFDCVTGASNAMAPDLCFRIEPPRVIAETQLGVLYQGPPGRVHGGFIAAVFDVVLARAQQLCGKVGVTGQLSVKYLDATPLNRLLRFEASLDRMEGKKVFVSGSCFDGETKTAEANGVWICTEFMNPGHT